jgi:hypothetical protein
MNTYRLYILIVILFFRTGIYSQTQLENGDFENWTNAYNATGWNSEVNFGFTINTAERTTDSNSGTYAAKLETQSYFTLTVPGMITLGEIDIQNIMPTGGVPFADRPTGISFYMKYTSTQDTMLMITYFTKWNPSTLNSDTIGGIFYLKNEEVAEYTKISLPIIYRSEEIPDTVNILFLSSLVSGDAGSTLFIDDITMEYGILPYPTICLPATNITENEFTAHWISIPDAISYFIDVAYDPEFTNFVENYNNFEVGNENSSTIMLTDPQSDYYYRVRVNYDLGQSINSNKINVNIPLPTVCIQATNITYQSFTANWNMVDNATNYYLDISTDENFSTFIDGYENFETGITDFTNISNLTQSTEYFYKIRVQYNNYTTSNSNTISLITDNYVNISELESDDISINSSDKKITIETKNNKIYELTIYNISGTKIIQTSISNSKTNIEIEKPGIYILNFVDKNNKITKKIIVY